MITDGEGKVTGFEKACIRCGHCGAYCPENAFRLETLRETASPDALGSILESRRSARLFNPRNLTDEELERLLSPVGFAPTGTNSQGVTVVVIQGVDRIQKLVVRPLRRFLTPFLPLAGLMGLGRHADDFRRGGDPVTRRAPCLLLFFVPRRNRTPFEDGVIGAAMVTLQAQAMGLGCLWNGVVKILFPFLPRLSKARPRGTRLRAVLCAGEAEIRPFHRVPERNWKTIIY